MVRITISLLTLGLATLISAQGTQFITGVCTSDADCASGCCGFRSGKCAGAIVAQERDGGCGFGDSTPNDRAAVALGFTGGVGGGAAAGGNNDNGAAANNGGGAQNSNPPAGQGNGSGARTGGGAANDGAGANNGATAGGNGGAAAATGNGAQFITGACQSDSDCASDCCGFRSGKCAGPVIAQERDGGCGFGDGTPNDRAAQAFRAGAKRGLQYQWE